MGIWFLLKGSRQAQGPAAAGVGLLAIFVGASRGAVFAHGVVLSALPATATRAAVALALGAGFAALVGGGLLVAATPFTTATTERILELEARL